MTDYKQLYKDMGDYRGFHIGSEEASGRITYVVSRPFMAEKRFTSIRDARSYIDSVVKTDVKNEVHQGKKLYGI